MPTKNLTTTLSKAIDPFRIFVVLIVAIILWLVPTLFRTETQSVLASPLRRDCRVCAYWNETCSSNGCRSEGCAVWVWEPCEGGGDPLPLTISGVLNCQHPGNNGWCKGGLVIQLSTSGPQEDERIISGYVNGIDFACPKGNIACTEPITMERSGAISYTVNSEAGDTASGTASYSLDATTPQIDGSVNGASGMNDWFVSEAEFSASASDAVSGLAALEISIDGGGWEAYDNSSITLSNGVHTVSVRAYDNAGNVAETVQTINVDTITPLLDVSVSGVAGSNNWYVSETEVSAIASDSISELSTLEIRVDGGEWETYTTPILLSDGIHNTQFRATDNAGNVTTAEQEVKVDTITPSLTLAISGRKGLNDWRTSTTQVSAATNDSGSGIAMLEVIVDGGAWSIVNGPLSLSDGLHTWQFRVKDLAGNLTESPVQNIKIDTISPFIEMTEELSLGETLYYDLEDYGSGLSNYRAVIEDKAEKYKKVAWLDTLNGNDVQGEILWDGKFKDETKAGIGEYYLTLKISDAAGNETIKSAIVNVTLISLLKNLPVFTVPQSDTVISNEAVSEDAASEQIFGGSNSGATIERTSVSNTTGGENVLHETTTQISFSQKSQSTDSPVTNTSILWGMAAAALVGGTLAEWHKKRDEEESRRSAAREERLINGPSTYRRAAMDYQRALDNFRETLAKAETLGMSTTEVQALTEGVSDGEIGPSLEKAQKYIARKEMEANNQTYWIEKQEAANAAILQEVLAAQKEAEELQAAGLMAYYLGRKVGEMKNKPSQQEVIVEKAWNWAFENQIELSLGTGIVMGLAAVAIMIAASITAPLVIGGAVLATAVIVTLGTVAINNHFGMDLKSNLVSNLIAGTAAAFITAGLGAWFVGLTPTVSTNLVNACTNYATVCSQIGTVLDVGEEVALSGQLAYYTWTGDGDNATQTAIELQGELMDGGMPGNAIAKEVGEQLAKLGDEVPELLATYGDKIIPLLLQYGDDAADIIGVYGDEGIALLLKFGDKAGDVIDLVKKFGTPAVKVLNTVDLTSANKLLETLDYDVLDYAVKQGNDAIIALTGWSEKELLEFGPELALRAKKDAKALKAIKLLLDSGPIDPNSLTPKQKALINEIAVNSMQYTDEGQIVLGSVCKIQNSS
jgi:hypothetical protein